MDGHRDIHTIFDNEALKEHRSSLTKTRTGGIHMRAENNPHADDLRKELQESERYFHIAAG